MKAQSAIERTPTVKATFLKRQPKAVERKPKPVHYLRLMTQRLQALRQLNRVDARTRFVGKDEIVRAWTVSYFLPMLKGKDTLRPERKTPFEDGRTEWGPDGRPTVRRVAKPKKGLRLPRIFAPCKKFETAR
jgi:hypothetical protein